MAWYRPDPATDGPLTRNLVDKKLSLDAPFERRVPLEGSFERPFERSFELLYPRSLLATDLPTASQWKRLEPSMSICGAMVSLLPPVTCMYKLKPRLKKSAQHRSQTAAPLTCPVKLSYSRRLS